MWDGRVVTAPFREWLAPDQPLARRLPTPAVCYSREPWFFGTKRTQPILDAFHGVLVSSFYDPPVSQRMADAALNGTGVRHWFAVQVQARHPRLTPMPLGVDRRDIVLLDTTPKRAWAERDILLYANLNPRTAERRQVLGQYKHAQDWVRITGGACVSDYFSDLGRSRFVLSPGGRSWDCYRTYEALAMGAVPIVRRQPPISDVVEGLPVLVVDDWREVTRDWLERYEPPAEWNLARLTCAYWRDRIEQEM